MLWQWGLGPNVKPGLGIFSTHVQKWNWKLLFLGGTLWSFLSISFPHTTFQDKGPKVVDSYSKLQVCSHPLFNNSMPPSSHWLFEGLNYISSYQKESIMVPFANGTRRDNHIDSCNLLNKLRLTPCVGCFFNDLLSLQGTKLELVSIVLCTWKHTCTWNYSKSLF